MRNKLTNGDTEVSNMRFDMQNMTKVRLDILVQHTTVYLMIF